MFLSFLFVCESEFFNLFLLFALFFSFVCYGCIFTFFSVSFHYLILFIILDFSCILVPIRQDYRNATFE